MENRLWKKEYVYAVFVLFCLHIGPYLLLPVITVYGKMLSGSDAQAGMMASVFSLSGLFARFLSAWLLDRFPVRKVLLYFTGLMGAASFLYIFSSLYWQAFVLRGIQGLAYGITCTAMSTYIVNILDPQNRLEGIGYSALTGNLANAVCPAVSYLLLGEHVDRFQFLFIAVFVSAVFAFLSVLFLKPAKQHEIQKNRTLQGTDSLNGVLYLLAVPFLMWLCISFSSSPVSAFLSLFALEKGFGGIGFYFTVNMAGIIVSRLAMGRIVNSLGSRLTAVIMIVLIAMSLFFIANMSALWQLYALAFPFGFANGCLMPLINTLLVNSLPSEKSGLANAVFFAAGDAGFILGPTIWGIVARSTSYHTVFLTASVICAAAVVIPLAAGKELFKN